MTENDAKATCRCEPRFGMPHEPWCSALDLRYVTAALDDVCELAEDVAPRQRLDDVLRKARESVSDR